MKKLLLYGLVFLLSLISAFSTVLLEEDFQGVSSCSSFFSNAVGTGTWTPQRVSGGQNDTYSCDASTGATSNARYTQFNWDMTSGSYNVSIWLYRNANDLDVRLASDGAYSNQFAVGYVDTVSLTNLVYLDGGGWVDSGVSFPATTWKRVDYIRDGNDISMYFDGSLIHTATRSSINMSYFYGFIRDPNDGRLDSFIACDTASSCYTTPSVSQEVFTIVAKEAYDNADIAEFKTNISFVKYNPLDDHSGNNNNLENYGATYVGGGYAFDGVSSFMISNPHNFSSWTTSIDLELNDVTSTQVIYWNGKNNTGSNALTNNFMYVSSGNLFLRSGDSTGSSFVTSVTAINASQRYNVTGNYNGTHQNLYLNNVLVDSDAKTSIYTAGDILIFGFDGGGSYDFNGTIYDFKIFDDALTPSEVDGDLGYVVYYPFSNQFTTITARTTNSSIVFNETYDFSGNNNTLTNNGATYVDGGFSLDGTNDYLSLPVASCPNSNNMTVIITTTFNEFSGFQELWACKGTHKLEFRFNNVTLEFGLWNGASFTSLSNTTSLNTGQEYTFTLAKEGTSTEIYIDGDLIKSGTVTGTADTFTTYYLGDLSGSSFFLNGTIHNYKVWDEKLTSTQISAEQGETINYYDNLVTFYPLQRITNSTTANITTFKNDYLVSDTQTNYLTNTTLTAYLSQSQISLSATELITNASVNGNFTIGATTYGTNETINITAGDYNVTFSASGYFNKTQQITVTGGTSEAFIISDVGNSQVNVTFYQVVGNLSATNVSGYIYNSTYGYNETFDTGSTNYYAFNVVQDINITVVVNNALYSASEFSIYVNETYTNMTQYLYTFNSVLMTFYDQDTLLNLSGVNITVELISDLQSTLNYTNTSQLYLDLLAPETYTVRYSADGYAQSFYEFTLTNQSDTQLSLYLINESNVTDVTFIVLDEISTKLEDAIIKIHKYNPTTGNYILVEILTTNFEGEAVGSIKLGSEFYYFIVEYPSGTIVKTTTPSYIYDTTVQLPVVLTDPIATQFFQVNGISTSLVFNNATNNFKYTYSDGANLLEYGCLIVYRVTSLTRTVYNSSCNAGASGQVLLNVDNITGATYLAQGYVIFTDEAEAITNSLWKGFTDDQVFGELGLIGGLIIIITLVLLGVWNPAVSIVLGTLGLALIKIAGLITIGWGYVAGIIALGLILVFVISRRS